MTDRARISVFLLGAVLVAAVGSNLAAQPPAPNPEAKPAAPEAKPAVAAEQPAGPFRKLAPGVMKKVDPAVEKNECYAWHDVVELLAQHPDLALAKQVHFQREVWYLEFEFKPLRLIVVDVPQTSGKMQKKVIKYLIYKVTHSGKANRPVQLENGTWEYQEGTYDQPIRFIPGFVVEAPEYKYLYPERVVPVALGPIRLREDPNRPLVTSTDMPARPIKPGETVWGVAMWDDLDPRIDRFSVYVQGLTNAYRWKDEPGKFQKGSDLGTGRTLSRKTLAINFWRAGDEYYEREREIRLGAPGEVDYEWVYR